MMSAVMPSLKYCCSGSPLRFANGSTQIAMRGGPALVRGIGWRRHRAGGGRRDGAPKQALDRAHDFPEQRARGHVARLAQVRGVVGAEVDRQARGPELHRHQDASIGAVAGLAAHPAGFHGVGCPDDQHGAGALEFVGDHPVELLAGHDRRVPPHRPSLRLERGDDGRDARLVAAGVRDEDVRHADAVSSGVDGRSCAGPRSLTPGFPMRPT